MRFDEVQAGPSVDLCEFAGPIDFIIGFLNIPFFSIIRSHVIPSFHHRHRRSAEYTGSHSDIIGECGGWSAYWFAAGRNAAISSKINNTNCSKDYRADVICLAAAISGEGLR